MPSRNQEPNPNQESLFAINEQTGMVHPAELATPTPTTPNTDPMNDPNPGPAVNILERNAHMQNMLKRLGVMSRATGMQIAAETPFRRELEGRYDDVDRVVGNTAERSDRKHLEAKREYAKAFGLDAIIASGLMTEKDAKAMAARSYSQEVLPKFADAKGAKNRDAMKSWLNYQERTLTGQRTRKPRVALPKPSKVV